MKVHSYNIVTLLRSTEHTFLRHRNIQSIRNQQWRSRLLHKHRT